MMRRSVAAIAVVASASVACGAFLGPLDTSLGQDGGTADGASVDDAGSVDGFFADSGPPGIPPKGPTDASVLEAAVLDDASDACGPGGSGLLLQCSSRCPSTIFGSLALADDFGATTTYAQDWTGSWVSPTLTAQGLQFGPHPQSANWWDTYSPTQTKETDFGDVLLCVRFRLHVGTDPGDNSFQVSLRGGSEGMAFSYGVRTQYLVLQTKVDANDTWVTHSAALVPLSPGDDDVEMALYAKGNDFYAQMKEVATGRVYAMQASYALPATGLAALLGWQLAESLTVTRAAIGTPTVDAAARMAPRAH
jgi:hypothetical protein